MYLQALTVLAAATLTSAVTPAGFQPASQNTLFVQYGNQAANNGQVLPQQLTQVQPTIATAQRLPGTYAVVMVDLDIPTQSPPQTNTLLHWLQTGLVSSQQATVVGGGGQQQQQAFLLQNAQNTAPLAQYIGPNPPAQQPLSHRYTFVLVDHTNISPQGLQILQQSSQTRLGFSAMQVLQQAGLGNNVVAGNFFNVTNGGGGIGGPGLLPGANSTFGPNNPTQTNILIPPSTSRPVVRAAGSILSPQVGILTLCLLAVAGIFSIF